MKEKKNDPKEKMTIVEKIREETAPQHKLTYSLDDIVLKTVKERHPEANLTDEKTVNALFLEHYLDMKADFKVIERILETLLRRLDQNILTDNHLPATQQPSENREIAAEQDPETVRVIASFIDKNQLEGEKFNSFRNIFASIAEMFSQKTIDEDILAKILQLTNIDKDIKESYEKGIIEGRNQRIEEQLTQFAVEDGLYSTASTSMQHNENGYIERILKGRK